MKIRRKKDFRARVKDLEEKLEDLYELDKMLMEIAPSYKPDLDEGVLYNIIPVEPILSSKVSTARERENYYKEVESNEHTILQISSRKIKEKFKHSNIVIWYDEKTSLLKNLAYLMKKISIKLPMKAVLLNLSWNILQKTKNLQKGG